MNPARESEPGEVWVAGCNLATGYVGGQGADKFIDNPHAAHPGNYINSRRQKQGVMYCSGIGHDLRLVGRETTNFKTEK